MSFYETTYAFLELIWVDLAVLLTSVVFCIVGAIVFPKKSTSKVVADGPLTRIHKGCVAVVSACGLRRGAPAVPSRRITCAAQALDGNGFPSDRSRQAFEHALMDAQSRDAWKSMMRLLKEMQNLGFEIPQSFATRMFKDKTAVEACALLHSLTGAGVTPDVVMYNCAIGICVQAGDMQKAKNIGRELRSTTTRPDIITFCTLLKGCHAAEDLHGAKEILREMTATGHRPHAISFNTLINAAVTKGDFQTAWEIIEMRKQAGVPVDAYTVSIMMKTLRQRNSRRPLHHSHAPRVFQFLDESGVDFFSDEVLLTTVVDSCLWHKEFARLEGILESYFKSGLQPSVPVYGPLIKACKCIKRMDMAWKLWEEAVEERKLEPSPILFGCMLDALVCSDGIDKAIELFRHWKAVVPPTTVMYSTLAKGFLNAQQAGRAMQLLTEMRANDVPRSTILYNMVIGVHASQGELDAVQVLMQSMAADKCTPDIVTYSVVLKGYCQKGDLGTAYDILRQAKQSGVALDAIVYSSMFYGCYRHNRLDLTDDLVEDMHSYGLTPSHFTLSIIVKMYKRQGRTDRAYEVVRLLSRQPSPDARVAAALADLHK